MNENRLEQILRSDPRIEQIYEGSFCRDNLPVLKPNRIYLINSDYSSGPGEHYILLGTLGSPILGHKYSNKKIQWCCSYTTSPRSFPHIFKRIKDTGRTICTLRRRLQAPGATNCSIFTIFFAYCLSRGIDPAKMIKLFFKNIDVYKATIWVTVVIQTIFNLNESVERLLYDSNFGAN